MGGQLELSRIFFPLFKAPNTLLDRDFIHIPQLVVGDEGDEAHRAAALRADHRIDFIGLRFILHLILFLR